MADKTNLFSYSQPDTSEFEDDILTRDPRLPESKPPIEPLLSKYSYLTHIVFNPKYPPSNDAVFGAIFSEKNIFEQTVSAVLGRPIMLVDEPIAQAFNNAKNAALNSIRFDILGKGTDKVDYSIDMQRVYNKERLHARTVYYACRLLATQRVSDSEYENLPGVCITFIYENGKTPTNFVNRVSLYDQDHNKYSDILEIVEIYLKADLTASDSIYLHTIKDFLAIHSQADADVFSSKYTNTYAQALVQLYNAVTSTDYTRSLDKTNLDGGYLMVKLTEEERIRIEKKGIEKGIEQGIEKGIEQGREQAIFSYIAKCISKGETFDSIISNVTYIFDTSLADAKSLYTKVLNSKS